MQVFHFMFKAYMQRKIQLQKNTLIWNNSWNYLDCLDRIYNCSKNMERFTPLYAIAYAIMHERYG